MCVCSMIGLILIAMPIPEIYRCFDRMYERARKKRETIRYISRDQIALRI